MLHFPGKEPVRQGHLRSAGVGGSHLGHHHTHRRALPPAPVLPQSLRPVAPSIQHYNSSGNSSTTSSNSYYKSGPDTYVDQLVKRSASSVNAKNRAPIGKQCILKSWGEGQKAFTTFFPWNLGQHVGGEALKLSWVAFSPVLWRNIFDLCIGAKIGTYRGGEP